MSRDFEVLTTLRSEIRLRRSSSIKEFQSPLKIASTLAPPDSTPPAIAALSHSSGAQLTTAVTTTATSERTGTKYRPVAAGSNLAHIPDRGALCIEIGRHDIEATSRPVLSRDRGEDGGVHMYCDQVSQGFRLEKTRTYVVMNSKLAPDFEVVKASTLQIVRRSFETSIRPRRASHIDSTARASCPAAAASRP